MPKESNSLYILPCDHRDILRGLWNKHEPRGFVNGDQWVTYAKGVVLDGLLLAVAGGIDPRHVALLMDEELGAPVLERARDNQIVRFVPVDDGTVGPFVIQYGSNFPIHVERVAPDFVQALINYNPASPDAPDQAQRIAPLLDWLKGKDWRFMLELQVLPTAEQVAQRGRVSWIVSERPALIRRAISELKSMGARPDVWKLEPMPTPKEYAKTVEAMRADGQDHAVAVVLGGGASIEAVDASLESCANVPGFVGFAVGRSVWAEGVEGLARGDLTADAAAKAIAGTFSHFVATFEAARERGAA